MVLMASIIAVTFYLLLWTANRKQETIWRWEEYLYKERKRIEHLKTYDELIRKKQEENAECYSEINESLISDWKVQKEQYQPPNSISSPPHCHESHLDALLHSDREFVAARDTTPPTQQTSQVYYILLFHHTSQYSHLLKRSPKNSPFLVL